MGLLSTDIEQKLDESFTFGDLLLANGFHKGPRNGSYMWDYSEDYGFNIVIFLEHDNPQRLYLSAKPDYVKYFTFVDGSKFICSNIEQVIRLMGDYSRWFWQIRQKVLFETDDILDIQKIHFQYINSK